MLVRGDEGKEGREEGRKDEIEKKKKWKKNGDILVKWARVTKKKIETMNIGRRARKIIDTSVFVFL